jgi:hypothetical protein
MMRDNHINMREGGERMEGYHEVTVNMFSFAYESVTTDGVEGGAKEIDWLILLDTQNPLHESRE